jgi:hypothetical protein
MDTIEMSAVELHRGVVLASELASSARRAGGVQQPIDPGGRRPVTVEVILAAC